MTTTSSSKTKSSSSRSSSSGGGGGDVSIVISDDFEGGNIRYVKQRVNDHDASVIDVILKIKPDPFTELEKMAHMQYFSFRSTVTRTTKAKQQQKQKQTVRYVIQNASKVSYPEAWPGTTVFYHDSTTRTSRELDALEDVDGWKRNRDTFYTQGQLHWEHVHDFSSNSSEDVVHFSYFPLFTRARHDRLIDQCRNDATDTTQVEIKVLARSLEGRNVECVVAGTGPLKCYVIHRQHPGEIMAEHYAEGLLTRLLGLRQGRAEEDNGDHDAARRRALEKFTFYIVPCMCPDGAVRGHLRTNAVGANLNREWATTKEEYVAPTAERSPEVYGVLQHMKTTGVDCFVDVHGDEELPYNFISGAEHVPTWGPRLQALHGAFVASYGRFNSDMQSEYGYPPCESPEDVVPYMSIATNQIAKLFDCLAVTLEQPFKDCWSNTDPEYGWTPRRARKLGADLLDALLYVEPYLRCEETFWNQLPPEDAYVKTTDEFPGKPNDNNNDDDGARDQDGGGGGVFQMLKKRFYSDVHEVHKPRQQQQQHQ